MKIPNIFVPEKDLEGKVRNLLENAGCKRQEECFWIKARDIIRTSVYSEDWCSNNKLRIKITDFLQIRSDYSNNLHVTISVPVLKSVYEKDRRNSSVGNFINSKKYACAVSKAKKKMEKLEKHFDFNNLLSIVQTDSGLFSRIDEIFKEYAVGDYELEFQDEGKITLKGYNSSEEYDVFGEEYHMLYRFYEQYLTKYLPVEDSEKGFLHDLKTGIQNLFKK